MSKRHLLRADQLHMKVLEINAILAEGKGLPRKPSQQRSFTKYPRRPSEPNPRIYIAPTIDERTADDFVVFKGHTVIGIQREQGERFLEFFEASVATEIDMVQYRELVKQRDAAEHEIKRLVNGWSPPRHLPSPFGQDRFRAFDPTPAFEFVAGPLHFIGR